MKWFTLLPLWAIVNITAYLLSWFIAFFYKDQYDLIDNGHSWATEPRLPNWLSWFQTPDNSLNGDEAWLNMQEGHWAWRAMLQGYPTIQKYFGRLGWLLRNPAQGFECSDSIAADILSTDVVHCLGNPLINDKPNGVAGYCFTKIGHYWNLCVIIRIGKSKCCKIDIGWMLKTYAEQPSRVVTQRQAQYVVSLRFPSFVE